MQGSIGGRIRAFRESKGVDRAHLADTAGLTEEFVTMLEEGAAVPSIGPLQKVARALGVRLGTFMDDQISRDPIISRLAPHGGDTALHTGHGDSTACVYHSLGKGKSDRNMEPFFIEIFPEPGEPEAVSHQGEEFIAVLSGELLVQYGPDTHILKAGDTIYYNSIVPHHVGAAGDGKVEILAVLYNS
ncbi:MAG: cupin domain-containing protein [Desulfovibrio sp.]|jgi:transcriptional regulator with XRE-family HTH domain|nr:cupin domain-containing protein [Desulfovibrio sp.]